jgi:hypothetical protein
MVEPNANSLTPGNQGKPGPNALLRQDEVSVTYESKFTGQVSLTLKCSVCHQNLDVEYARGKGFGPHDLLLVAPHVCPGKVLNAQEAYDWDLHHRQLYKGPYCPASVKATRDVLK